MTNRERILATLRGEETDRVPLWLLFPFHSCPYYADARREPSYRQVFEAMMRSASVLDRRNLEIPVFAPEVADTREQRSGGDSKVTRRRIAWQGRELVSELREGPAGASEKRLIENDADLDLFLSLPLLDDEAAIGRALEPLLPTYLKERAEFPLEAGAMMLDLGEGIGVLYHAASLLEYPVWSLTRREEITSFLCRLQRHFIAKYRWCLERDLAEIYFLVGSELAAPPMVSPDTFDDWVLPFEKELVGLVHAYDALVISHFHGQIRGLLSRFVDIGCDGLHTIEAPPVGNCSLSEAFEFVGDRMALIGNIQYDDFRALTPDGMRKAVANILEESKGHRFILSPTAGPYEAELDAGKRDNYLAFLAACEELGYR
ncbi:MAG: uroporphyrinogen decarboxylase family protein [Spirochaetota bacterium]